MKKFGISILFIIVEIFFSLSNTFAQCAMCKGMAETSVQEGSLSVFGLNMGILYMFAMPYLLIVTIGYFWWKQSKKAKQQKLA